MTVGRRGAPRPVAPWLALLLCLWAGLFTPGRSGLTHAAAVAADPGAAALFEQGNAAYQAGHFDDAVRAYRQILARGQASPDLYYNLGNAALKVGQLGEAILNYRRALRLAPALADARANLEYARRRTADSQTTLGDDPFPWLSRLRPGADRAVFLFVIALNLAAILFAVRRVWRGTADFLGPVMLLAAVAAGLLAIVVFIERRIELHDTQGVVTQPAAEARTGPGAENTVAFVVHEGTEVNVLRTNGGWTEIALGPELKGWVDAAAVERVE